MCVYIYIYILPPLSFFSKCFSPAFLKKCFCCSLPNQLMRGLPHTENFNVWQMKTETEIYKRKSYAAVARAAVAAPHRLFMCEHTEVLYFCTISLYRLYCSKILTDFQEINPSKPHGSSLILMITGKSHF